MLEAYHTRVTAVELDEVLSLLQDFRLEHQPDQRFTVHGLPFSKNAYAQIIAEDDVDPNAALIWVSKAPNKVKVFAWLLFKDRLNKIANPLRKGIGSNSSCPICVAPSEDVLHLFLLCPFARQVWWRLGLMPHQAWDVGALEGLKPSVWPTVLLCDILTY